MYMFSFVYKEDKIDIIDTVDNFYIIVIKFEVIFLHFGFDRVSGLLQAEFSGSRRFVQDSAVHSLSNMKLNLKPRN